MAPKCKLSEFPRIGEAAAFVGITPRELTHLIDSGVIRSTYIDAQARRCRRVHRDEITKLREQLLANLK